MKKNVSLIVTVALVLISIFGFVVCAESKEVFSGREFTEWIIENVQPTYHKGYREGCAPFYADSGKTYTSQHIVEKYNATFNYHIGTLRSQCWWIIDMNQHITNFHCDHMAVPAPGTNFIAYSELGGAYLALPDNARTQVSGTFSDYFNAYSAHQVYNLRGDGGYEYRVFH